MGCVCVAFAVEFWVGVGLAFCVEIPVEFWVGGGLAFCVEIPVEFGEAVEVWFVLILL